MKFIKPIFLALLVVAITLSVINIFNNLKPQPSSLTVDSIPQADIYINGTKKGKTPYKNIFKESELHLEIKSKDLLTFEKYLNPNPGTKTVVKVTLGETLDKTEEEILSVAKSGEKLSSISISTDPDNVQIYIDGKFIGFTPQKIISVAPSVHELTLIKPGFNQKVINLKTTQGYTLEAFAKLGSSNSSIQN